jgi:hypothetical protein
MKPIVLASTIASQQISVAERREFYARIDELKAAIQEACDFIEDYADVVDGPDGPEANQAMSLCTYLTEILEK